MSIILFILLFFYVAVMLFYAFKFRTFKTVDLKFTEPKTTFSIIIPFRNEAENLPHLLKSLSELNYPKNLFEIYLVDDFSDDESKAICIKFIEKYRLTNARVLTNQNFAISPKKSAVLTALENIETSYVITTDADCLLPKNWLLHFDQHIQKYKPSLIAGAVCMATEKKFWSRFQVLDLMSLQVVGLGSFKSKNPLLCNAANLAYEVKTLKRLQAFDQHQQYISGDDIFNLEVFRQASEKISALVHPEAIVWTKAEPDFKSLTQQRIRWASKAKHYKNKTLISLGLLVFFTNLLLVLSLVLLWLLDAFRPYLWAFWLIKLTADFVVLNIGRAFFKPGICIRDYLLMLVVYPFVSVYFAVLSFGGKFSWKGRAYKV